MLGYCIVCMVAKNIQFSAIDSLHSCYGEVSSLIRSVYCQKYSAILPAVYEHLIVAFENNRPVAALGFKIASNESFFLECYLDEVVESAMASHALLAKRSDIVEIGHLVSTVSHGSWGLIQYTAWYLLGLGYSWVVFTATQGLRYIFSSLGVTLHALKAADRARIGDANIQKSWGTYYESEPMIVASNLHDMFQAVSIKVPSELKLPERKSA